MKGVSPIGSGTARGFWVLVALLLIAILVVAVRSPLVAVLLTVVLGVGLYLMTIVGTRAGNAILLAVFLTAVIAIPSEYAMSWRLPVGGGGIFITDVLLGLLLVSLLVMVILEREFVIGRSPLNLPLFLFLLWVAVAAVIGQQTGNQMKLIVQDLRSLLHYGVFFAVMMLVRDREQVLRVLKLLAVCLVIAFLTGVFYDLQGQGMALEFVEAGVSRFPAPDDLFLMGSLLLTSFVLVWPEGKRRPLWLWGLLGIVFLGLVLSFVRGNWLSFAVGLFFLWLMVFPRERVRLILGGILLGTLFAAALAVTSPAVFNSVVSRAMAVTAVAVDPNVQWRFIENKAALQQIHERPLFGNGLGREYLFDWSRYGVEPYYKSYIHNNYLWFWHRLGLVGLALFAWMMIAFLVPWIRQRELISRDDPWLSGLVYGSRAMIIALLLNSISSPRFNSKLSVAVFATVMALSEISLALMVARSEEQEALEGGEDGDAGVSPDE